MTHVWGTAASHSSISLGLARVNAEKRHLLDSLLAMLISSWISDLEGALG
jgi:hypothetical protein